MLCYLVYETQERERGQERNNLSYINTSFRGTKQNQSHQYLPLPRYLIVHLTDFEVLRDKA